MFKKSLIAVIMSALLLTSATTAFADTDVDAEGTNKTSYAVSGTTAGSQTTEKTETFDLPIPDYFGDDTYDTKGNLSLIKQEKIIYDSEEMQFIAVTTKDGHVFYILIDYTAVKAAENGEEGADARETVYFLNKVDDYDLFTLLYEDSDEDNPYTNYAMGGFGGSSDTDTENVESDDTEEKGGSSGFPTWIVMIGFIALVGVGYWFLKIRPGKKSPAFDDDDDFDYDNDYESDDTAEDEPKSTDE